MTQLTPQNAWTRHSAPGLTSNPGPFIGEIMRNDDPLRAGRLLVYIPDLGGDPAQETSWSMVRYMTPFYGIQPLSNALVQGGQSGKIESYGMWLTPPSTGVKVLVMFVNGDRSRGVWMGCLPEIGSHGAVPGQDLGDVDVYVAENYKTAATDIGSLERPPHSTAPTYDAQGLTADLARGPLTSSSMRESPSHVFGINTPGSHSFVMDDGDEAGVNKVIRLRTATGNQIMMNDDSGFVYVINSAGTGWIELSPTGHIDVYGEAGINLATKGSINMHADQNINMHAGNSIKIVAADGVKIQGTNEAQIYGKKLFLEGVDSIEQHSCNEIKITSFGDTFLKGFGNFVLQGKCFRWNSGTAKEAEQVPPEVPAELSGYNTTVARAPSREPWAGHDGAEGAADGSAITAQPGVTETTPILAGAASPTNPATSTTPKPTAQAFVIAAGGVTDANNPSLVYESTIAALKAAKGKGYSPLVVVLPDSNNSATKPMADAMRRAAVEAGASIEDLQFNENGTISSAGARLVQKKYPGAMVVGGTDATRLGGTDYASTGASLAQSVGKFVSSNATAIPTPTPKPMLTGTVSTAPVPKGSSKGITPSIGSLLEGGVPGISSLTTGLASKGKALFKGITGGITPGKPLSFGPPNPTVPGTSNSNTGIAAAGKWVNRPDNNKSVAEPTANLGRTTGAPPAAGASAANPLDTVTQFAAGPTTALSNPPAVAAASYPGVASQGAMSSIPANPGGGNTGDFAVGDNCQTPTAGGTTGGVGDPGSNYYAGGPPGKNVVPPESLKNDPAFQAKLAEMKVKYPGLSDDAIYRVINGESAFDTKALNYDFEKQKGSRAAGLFQFIPRTAAGLGYTTEQILNMNAAEQLGVYDKYLSQNGYRGGPLGIMQAAPGYASKPGDFEVYSPGTAEYAQNPPWRGPDGRITVNSINAYYGY